LGITSFIKNKKENVFILILLTAPFIYLFPYVFPLSISGFDISVGNDFRILYYNYKVYLLHFLSRLEIPYWSPSEAAGYPFYSNPFTQFYYPLNVPLALFYKLTGGYSSVDHHRYTVLGFSILSAGLYKWLRTLKINPVASFISALLITSSIGSLEMLRFPNAIHTLCWFPWILFSINKIFLSENKYGYIKYSFLLFVCFVCAVTAGYPYYLYYSLFIFIPYFLFFIFTYTRINILKVEKNTVVKPAIIILVTIVLVFAACYPYLHSVSGLMNQTNGRVGDSYEYSTNTAETPLSTLGSLVYPPLSSIDTSFYIGLLNLFVLLMYFVNVNKDKRRWILLLWVSLLVYITYSSNSLLFNFLWNYFPFFSSLREWGRMNKILLILFAWLLGIAYSDLFERINNSNLYFRKTEIILVTASIVTLLFSTIASVFKLTSVEWQQYFVNSKVEMLQIFSPKFADSLKFILSGYGYIFVFFSALVLFVILKYYRGNRMQMLSNKTNILAIFIVVFSFLESYTFSPWLWIKAEKSKKKESLVIDNKTAFETQRTFLYKTVSLNNNYNSGIVEDWYYKSYVDFLKKYGSDTVSLNKLLGVNSSKKLYFTSDINYNDIKSFLSDADTSSADIKLINYNGNSLELTVNSKSDGYLNFIDNWDEKWMATVNSNPVIIEKLLGTFKSIHIIKGFNNISFEYRPF
jgi:hypothetical protein